MTVKTEEPIKNMHYLIGMITGEEKTRKQQLDVAFSCDLPGVYKNIKNKIKIKAPFWELAHSVNKSHKKTSVNFFCLLKLW